MSFGVLALIVLAGLAGPALALARPAIVPVVVGELFAGVAIGRSGFRWLSADQPTALFLGDVGFAMLMFAAGMQVPLRRPGIARGLARGALAAVVVAALAIPAAIGAARITSSGHEALYTLLLASGSAAILLPILEEERLLDDSRALTVMAQVAIADVAAIVALPLVLQPGRAVRATLGGLLVAAGVLVIFVLVRAIRALEWTHRLRRLSKERAWALDLRLSLLALFALAWIATKSSTSVLIAGFGVGLLVAALGGPVRLSTQVTGIGQGFFIPLFFVVLGAGLDVRALGQQASLVELALLLVALNLAIHALAALASRQPLAAGLAATAQLGVPAAAVTIGLRQHLLERGQGAAIIAAALATLPLCALGGASLAKISRVSHARRQGAVRGDTGRPIGG
ncbi:MAG: cation:proton antiporter domain-containing protein [Gaiellaceae bacterium]